MSICPNVTEQVMINVAKLLGQQRNQRAIKIKNNFLEQTHDKKLTELDEFSSITKKIKGNE